jgi:RNA recognition motif-containing protein
MKPQGFGFAEFEEPSGAIRAIELLNNVELPALEDGCVNKKLLVRLLKIYRLCKPTSELSGETG